MLISYYVKFLFKKAEMCSIYFDKLYIISGAALGISEECIRSLNKNLFSLKSVQQLFSKT